MYYKTSFKDLYLIWSISIHLCIKYIYVLIWKLLLQFQHLCVAKVYKHTWTLQATLLVNYNRYSLGNITSYSQYQGNIHESVYSWVYTKILKHTIWRDTIKENTNINTHIIRCYSMGQLLNLTILMAFTYCS